MEFRSIPWNSDHRSHHVTCTILCHSSNVLTTVGGEDQWSRMCKNITTQQRCCKWCGTINFVKCLATTPVLDLDMYYSLIPSKSEAWERGYEFPTSASSEQGGLIIHCELIYEFTPYKRPIPTQAEEGGGLIICTIRYRCLTILWPRAGL